VVAALTDLIGNRLAGVVMCLLECLASGPSLCGAAERRTVAGTLASAELFLEKVALEPATMLACELTNADGEQFCRFPCSSFAPVDGRDNTRTFAQCGCCHRLWS
jgi:hypothetical protein